MMFAVGVAGGAMTHWIIGHRSGSGEFCFGKMTFLTLLIKPPSAAFNVSCLEMSVCFEGERSK